MQNTDAPYRVGLWPVPGYAMMSCASVVEPLRAANLLAPAPVFDVSVFAEDGGAVSSCGASLPGTHRPGDKPALDLFLVIAGGDPFGFKDRHALRWLADLSDYVPAMGGVSGGPVILALAGLMQGRSFTVHWEHAEALSRRHPDVAIKRRLFMMERDRVTCGGGTAPMDLMHAVIARLHGKVFARRVSDWFLHTDVRAASAPQRGQFADDLDTAPPAVREAIAVMEDHLSDPLSLSQLGLITGVSPRHLNRLFAAHLNSAPMTLYRKMRLDAGRQLVETTHLGLAEIAEATGFQSAAHFSNQYAQVFGMRPAQQRRPGKPRPK